MRAAPDEAMRGLFDYKSRVSIRERVDDRAER